MGTLSTWTAFSPVFNEATAGYHPHTGNALIDATQFTVTADGEGLKNALEAFNQGHLGISPDGGSVYWNSGGVISDIHANTPGAFWGILEDQNLLHPNSIIGIAHA